MLPRSTYLSIKPENVPPRVALCWDLPGGCSRHGHQHPREQPETIEGTSDPLIPSTGDRESQTPKCYTLRWLLLDGKHACTVRSP